MPLSEQEICEQALRLPDGVKEHLAETPMASLSKKVDPAIERAHLDIVKRRRDQIRSGRISAVDGKAVMAEARRMIKSGNGVEKCPASHAAVD